MGRPMAVLVTDAEPESCSNEPLAVGSMQESCHALLDSSLQKITWECMDTERESKGPLIHSSLQIVPSST